MIKKASLPLMLLLASFGSSASAATAPGAPTAVTAAPGNTYASVAFTAPASDGGSPVLAYTAVANPGNITVTGPSSPLIVTGLTNGTRYAFTVFATNAAGNGPVSAPSDTVTPGVPAAPAVSYGETVFVETVGVAVSHVPVVTGTLTGCAIYPDLPTGLRIIQTTCALTGTPQVASAASNYSVVASNGSSFSTVTLNLRVAANPSAIAMGGPGRANGGNPLRFSLTPDLAARARSATVSVADAWGRAVREQSIPLAAIRSGQVAWDGRTAGGSRAPAGLYLLRARVEGAAGPVTWTRKVVLTGGW